MTTLFMMPPNNLHPPSNTNKRKRESNDVMDGSRRKSQNTNGDTGNDNDDELSLQLLQGIGQEALREGDDANTRTAQAALNAPMPQNTYPPHGLSSFDDGPNSPPTGFNAIPPTAQALMDARQATTTNHNKPAVGSQQWHQQRKDNHKEGKTTTDLHRRCWRTNTPTVERRRRETINEGINELAKVIPGSDKNKGAILQSAVSYIAELLNKQHSWENERATLDIAIKELATRNDKMRESMEQAWAESAKWQKRCRDARLPYEDYDDGALQDDGLDV
jgi:transcriptional regulator CBF1